MPVVHNTDKHHYIPSLNLNYECLLSCKVTRSCILQWMVILSMACLLGGIVIIAVEPAWIFSLPLVIAGILFMVLGGIILIALRKRQPIRSIPKTDLTLSGVADHLRHTFTLEQVVSRANKINKNTECVYLRHKNANLQLCLHQGHPLNDPLLKNKDSAILLCINSERHFSYAINRTLALIGRIDKDCWEEITQPGSRTFPPGAIAHGPWVNKSQITAPASYLIFINPPTIETLMHTDTHLPTAMTWQDVPYEKAFDNIVNAYLECFRICRENRISSIQIELLGLGDIRPSQEEYDSWYSQCALALLEAIDIEEKNKKRTVVQITVNHLKELPLLLVLQEAFNKNRN
ncbi:hypothetical protein NVRI1_00899 [Chlamydia abortus]|uniref:hypothetical protein n=1 Tax=Chlamydia abortus TaxID=83555 RepID=UPI00192C724A|nr:hypothetical protein [Chlamydia abortus]CAD7584231.1 hypothetical protein [Chlamydia abortus]CAG9046536.1 hypothetical protein NVRI1_00899 [Chlamydia abortus]